MSELVETVVRRTIELAEIPAPTGAEAERAALVRSWWELDGVEEIHADEAGNLWGRARGGGEPAIVLCAHLDTVFGAEIPHGVRVEDDRLIGPSVGDDSVGVASLSAAATHLRADGIAVWLLATVGEEGLGNLRGARAALDAPAAPVAAFVAVEGNYLGRVSGVGVGSVRRRIRVVGPGGHAWEAAGAPSAVHAVAALASSIAAIPAREGTSVNVGRIGGGEGINVRAREAWLEFDLRAEDPAVLASIASQVEALLGDLDPALSLERDVLGDRPAGHVAPDHALVRAAKEALSDVGLASVTPATSTDANAAHARGIPAVAVGVTKGAGEHTAGEWIEIGPIGDGVRALARTVERFEELTA